MYAAASLREVLGDLTGPAERELGVRPVFHFAASSDLARQILAAPKADVFFSADEVSMDGLEESDLLDAGSRRSLLTNELVVIVPGTGAVAIRSVGDFVAPSVRRLAIADPEFVPAGRYARAWLEAAGVWTAVRDRIVPAIDVRAALAAVETGAVDAGIVYRTDAAISSRVRVAFEIPPGDGPSISYPVAVIAGRPAIDDARRFVSWLFSARTSEVFRRAGFGLAEGVPAP